MENKKYLILGDGEHGKDYLAELFQDLAGISFVSSSWAACEKAVFPYLYRYDTPTECYNDRRNHRATWKKLITQYNTPDKARLCREILSENDCYVGMRCPLEYEASKNMFHKIFFIDASNRKGVDFSMGIGYNEQEMLKIDNNGSKEDLRRFVEMHWRELLS